MKYVGIIITLILIIGGFIYYNEYTNETISNATEFFSPPQEIKEKPEVDVKSSVLKKLLNFTSFNEVYAQEIIEEPPVFEIFNPETKAIEVESIKNVDGSYKQEKWNGFLEVVVYETPLGEFGYEIITRENRLVSTYGFGPEADERTNSFVAPISEKTLQVF